MGIVKATPKMIESIAAAAYETDRARHVIVDSPAGLPWDELSCAKQEPLIVEARLAISGKKIRYADDPGIRLRVMVARAMAQTIGVQ